MSRVFNLRCCLCVVSTAPFPFQTHTQSGNWDYCPSFIRLRERFIDLTSPQSYSEWDEEQMAQELLAAAAFGSSDTYAQRRLGYRRLLGRCDTSVRVCVHITCHGGCCILQWCALLAAVLQCYAFMLTKSLGLHSATCTDMCFGVLRAACSVVRPWMWWVLSCCMHSPSMLSSVTSGQCCSQGCLQLQAGYLWAYWGCTCCPPGQNATVVSQGNIPVAGWLFDGVVML